MIGTKLGKYDVLEEIGKGGMAVVYRGFDTELEREVAIKVLHPHLSAQPESKRRFHREARAVARLRATNILEIYDYSGKDSEQAFIVTEFIHGPTLRTFVEEHAELPIEVAVLIALEICRGLRHAHENQVIHRDIKPENIMVRADGVMKITDFGIAQMAGTTQMTVTGQILGSPAHMSPEHVENKPLDFRADLFSMGTLLYWLVTGRLPFEGRNPHAVIKRIVEGDYPDPMRARPAMGERLARIVRRCLEVDPADRYPSVEELIEALTAFLSDLEVSPTGRELRRYFEDPVDYTARHEQKLLPRLIERGKEERRNRNIAAALDYFNRALAIDDTNEEVLAIVERMSASTRLRKRLEIGAAVATVLLAATAIGWAVLRHGATTERGRADTALALVVPDADPADGGQVVDAPSPDARAESSEDASGSDESSRDGSALRRIKRAIVRPVGLPLRRQTRWVRVVPNPPVARVVVDGRDYGEFRRDIASRGISLSVGAHRARFEPLNDAYEPLEFDLTVPEAGPDAGLLTVTRRLPISPAVVRIDAQPPGATVFIPHRERSPANQAFRVRLQAIEERLQIIVAADGYRSEGWEVVLRAGQEYSREVVLQPERPADGLATTTTP